MDTESKARLIEVFNTALALKPEDRAAFLAEACNGNETLRREVESLLAHAPSDNGFLEKPAVERYAKDLIDAAPFDLIGQQLGHYLLTEAIGSGGMGQVYKARDQKLGREVAIKILPPEFTADATLVRRFEQEARAASALNHPHIITIHEIGQHGEMQFIVMELVAGQTLRARLQAGKLPHAEALDIAAQVADALVAAHHVGIIHRDIKPENIMLRVDGRVKVLDFGIAKLGEDLEGGRKGGRGEREKGRGRETETTAFVVSATLPHSLSPLLPLSATLPLSTALGSVLGTVNYMSPEQARGEPLNGQADVFSLGQILLEMVTGKRLFAGIATNDVLRRLRSGQEPLAAEYKLEGVPQALEQIIRKALRRELHTRYATAREMLVDLQSLQRRTATKRLRRTVMAGLSGMLVLLLLLVVSAWNAVQETWAEKILSDGHSATVRRAVFSADGKRLISVSQDRRVMVWDFARRELIQSLLAHQDQINAVAFAPDGKWFATGSHDKRVIVWNGETLQPERIIEEHRDKVMAVAFSPDGQWLASASGSDTGASRDFRTVLWNVNGWQKVREFTEGRSYGNLLFSPDSRWLKTQDSQWDVATGTKLTGDGLGWNWNEFAPGAKQLLGAEAGGVEFFQLAQAGQLADRKKIGSYVGDKSPHQDFVRAAAYSPDGKLAATAANDIVLWDTATMQLRGRFSPASSVWSLTFSPDGRWLVSAHGDGTMLVWNLAQQRREFSFNAHAEAVRAVAISPDGKRYASAGDDRSIIVWRAETGLKEAVLVRHHTRIINLVFSPDSQWLASLDQAGRLIRWELESRTAVWEVQVSSGASCLVVSPDGQWLVTRHAVINSADGQRAFGLGSPENDMTFLGAASFASDGKRLAGVEGNQLLLMDLWQKRILERQMNGNVPLVVVQFSPDNSTLVTGSADGSLFLWDIQPLRLRGLLGKHAGQVATVSFSRDGKLLASASADKTVKLWDVHHRELLHELGIHAAPVAAVAFSADGKLLTGEQDRSVRLYTRQRELWGRALK